MRTQQDQKLPPGSTPTQEVAGKEAQTALEMALRPGAVVTAESVLALKAQLTLGGPGEMLRGSPVTWNEVQIAAQVLPAHASLKGSAPDDSLAIQAIKALATFDGSKDTSFHRGVRTSLLEVVGAWGVDKPEALAVILPDLRKASAAGAVHTPGAFPEIVRLGEALRGCVNETVPLGPLAQLIASAGVATSKTMALIAEAPRIAENLTGFAPSQVTAAVMAVYPPGGTIAARIPNLGSPNPELMRVGMHAVEFRLTEQCSPVDSEREFLFALKTVSEIGANRDAELKLWEGARSVREVHLTKVIERNFAAGLAARSTFDGDGLITPDLAASRLATLAKIGVYDFATSAQDSRKSGPTVHQNLLDALQKTQAAAVARGGRENAIPFVAEILKSAAATQGAPSLVDVVVQLENSLALNASREINRLMSLSNRNALTDQMLKTWADTETYVMTGKLAADILTLLEKSSTLPNRPKSGLEPRPDLDRVDPQVANFSRLNQVAQFMVNLTVLAEAGTFVSVRGEPHPPVMGVDRLIRSAVETVNRPHEAHGVDGFFYEAIGNVAILTKPLSVVVPGKPDRAVECREIRLFEVGARDLFGVNYRAGGKGQGEMDAVVMVFDTPFSDRNGVEIDGEIVKHVHIVDWKRAHMTLEHSLRDNIRQAERMQEFDRASDRMRGGVDFKRSFAYGIVIGERDTERTSAVVAQLRPYGVMYNMVAPDGVVAKLGR